MVLHVYALYTPYIRPIYALYTPYIRPIYALYTPYIRPIYALYTPYIRPIYALYIYIVIIQSVTQIGIGLCVSAGDLRLINHRSS